MASCFFSGRTLPTVCPKQRLSPFLCSSLANVGRNRASLCRRTKRGSRGRDGSHACRGKHPRVRREHRRSLRRRVHPLWKISRSVRASVGGNPKKSRKKPRVVSRRQL